MIAAPVITIFVRHAAGCKYAGDEFTKRCNCRKHLRWTHNSKQHRLSAGTRSWAEAETKKREVEDQLAGRVVAPASEKPRDVPGCISVFIQDKKVQGVTEGVIQKYEHFLRRLQTYCESRGVHIVTGITREVITGFMSRWPEWYPSTLTRAKTRERLRSFLRYCYEAQWIDRVPPVPAIKVIEPETQPLTPKEYEALLDAVYVAIDSKRDGLALQTKVHTFLETMRWTGLAILDALTLRRSAVTKDPKGKMYRVTTKRKKTGTPVSIPLPARVAEALLALPDEGEYFFWSGEGKPQSARSNWGQRYISPVFKAAGVKGDNNMVSHRLRDTFAVGLLEKGVPMEEVSKLLGHTSIRTTEKSYAKWSKGRQDRVDNLVSATW